MIRRLIAAPPAIAARGEPPAWAIPRAAASPSRRRFRASVSFTAVNASGMSMPSGSPVRNSAVASAIAFRCELRWSADRSPVAAHASRALAAACRADARAWRRSRLAPAPAEPRRKRDWGSNHPGAALPGGGVVVGAGQEGIPEPEGDEDVVLVGLALDGSEQRGTASGPRRRSRAGSAWRGRRRRRVRARRGHGCVRTRRRSGVGPRPDRGRACRREQVDDDRRAQLAAGPPARSRLLSQPTGVKAIERVLDPDVRAGLARSTAMRLCDVEARQQQVDQSRARPR